MRALVIDGDLVALRAHLDGLTGGDLQAARRWVARTHDVDRHPLPPELGDWSDEGTHERYVSMRRARLVSHARLGTPAAAVKAAAAELSSWDDQRPELEAAFLEKDKPWLEAFARSADAVRPSARGAALVWMLLDAVVRSHGLPCPTGALFHEGWIRQVQGQVEPWAWTGRTPTLDPLRADPLLPDVVYHQLASGEVGRWPGFAQVLPTLAQEGLIDRDRTLAVALEQMTAGQRPSSQKALAGVLTALELRADEVPGGLDLLLSILSSCHASAVGTVLDLAIDLVLTGDDAVELARVVAPRPQKGVRRRLLRALAPGALGSRIDPAELLEAIDVLASGDDDATERAGYDKARLTLGGPAAPAPAPDRPAALGLWDLALPTPPAGHAWHPWPHPRLRDRLWALLRTGSSATDDSRLAGDLLDALAQDRIAAPEISAAAQELAVEGRLSPTRAAGLLEALFLGGAMRTTWSVALEIADLCAAAPRPAPGLDRLLGFLATYAVEVPHAMDLPAHLVRLCGGRSKAAQEARRLADLLASSLEPRDPAPTFLGLWTERTELPPWGLAYPPTRDLSTIGVRVAQAPAGPHEVPGAVRRSVLTSLLLDELTALVADHGAEAVRAETADVGIRERRPMARAVRLWSQGLLTPASYWAMARSTASVADLLPAWLEEMGTTDAYSRFFDWTLDDGLAAAEPVMPRWWSEHGQGTTRLEFLHTCEALLVAERGGRVVSTPDVIDGSLGLDHLRERLAAAPRVGPIDLRLALGRLRPAPAGGMTGIVTTAVTDPAVTSPDASRQDSAGERVRQWLEGGGLRLEPRGRDASGNVTYEGECPVPWQSCEALAHTGVDDGAPGSRSNDAFTIPGRPDVWLRQGLFAIGDRDGGVAEVGGPIGSRGWSAILDALGTPPAHINLDPDFTDLVGLQDQGRLDPATAAAAAVARWDDMSSDDGDGALRWERAMLRGALRGLWPVAVAVVEAGMERDERPAEVDALVEVMRRHAHEVPADRVPTWLAGAR